jgi:hypothetical protein
MEITMLEENAPTVNDLIDESRELAWWEGFNAISNENPYTKNTDAHQWWADGYASAKSDQNYWENH